MVRDPATGKYRRTRLFVLTLGYSRKSVRLLTWRSSSQHWAALHEEAFRRLGGSVRVVVLDNPREGVLQPDVDDPTRNPLYRDVLAHDGVVALPCRVRDPDRKGKVEAGVGHAQRTPLKGLRFETLDAAQACLDAWETRWADTRIHGTTTRHVSAMLAEERPSLQSLPLEPFRYYRFGLRTVHLDGCVEVEAAYYMRTTACRRAGSGGGSPSGGTPSTSACWCPPPARSCASMSARAAGTIASPPRTARPGRPSRRSPCWSGRSARGHPSAPCARTSMRPTGCARRAGSWASWRSPGRTARRARRRPRTSRWRPGSRRTASSGAPSNA
jgi:hypothetical protein